MAEQCILMQSHKQNIMWYAMLKLCVHTWNYRVNKWAREEKKNCCEIKEIRILIKFYAHNMQLWFSWNAIFYGYFSSVIAISKWTGLTANVAISHVDLITHEKTGESLKHRKNRCELRTAKKAHEKIHFFRRSVQPTNYKIVKKLII